MPATTAALASPHCTDHVTEHSPFRRRAAREAALAIVGVPVPLFLLREEEPAELRSAVHRPDRAISTRWPRLTKRCRPLRKGSGPPSHVQRSYRCNIRSDTITFLNAAARAGIIEHQLSAPTVQVSEQCVPARAHEGNVTAPVTQRWRRIVSPNAIPLTGCAAPESASGCHADESGPAANRAADLKTHLHSRSPTVQPPGRLPAIARTSEPLFHLGISGQRYLLLGGRNGTSFSREREG